MCKYVSLGDFSEPSITECELNNEKHKIGRLNATKF